MFKPDSIYTQTREPGQKLVYSHRQFCVAIKVKKQQHLNLFCSSPLPDPLAGLPNFLHQPSQAPRSHLMPSYIPKIKLELTKGLKEIKDSNRQFFFFFLLRSTICRNILTCGNTQKWAILFRQTSEHLFFFLLTQ